MLTGSFILPKQRNYSFFYKIHNDLDLVMDCGEVTCILLDLFAPFDTVDHSSFSLALVFTRFDGLSLIWPSSHLSSRYLIVSINDSISAFFTLSCGVPQVPFLTHCSILSILFLWFDDLKKFPNIHCIIGTLMVSSCTSLSLQRILFYFLKHSPPLSLSFSPGWTWTNCSSIPQNLNSLLLAENHNVSNLLISQTIISQQWYHPSQFLWSQSWFHLCLWHVFLCIDWINIVI